MLKSWNPMWGLHALALTISLCTTEGKKEAANQEPPTDWSPPASACKIADPEIDAARPPLESVGPDSECSFSAAINLP